MNRKMLAGLLVLLFTGFAWAGTTTTNGWLYQPGLGSSGQTEWNSMLAGFQRVDSRLAREIWVGDAGYATLPAAITAAGSTATHIHLGSGTYTLTANLTVPSNVTLQVDKGALVFVPTGLTLTINGAVLAGDYQIFSCTGTGAVVLNPAHTPTAMLDWWGAAGDASTDDTIPVQAAFSAFNGKAGRLLCSSATYKLTSPITVSNAEVIGLPVSPSTRDVVPWTGIPSLGSGTWFHLAHTGIGFNCTTAGFVLKNLGTYRTQPAPAGGYAPTAHNYDFVVDTVYDGEISNVCLLNPTKGIDVKGGGGRIKLFNITGQPLQKGIVIEYATDVCWLQNIHFWPHWSKDTNIYAYTAANCDGVQLFKADGCEMNNIFTYSCQSTLRLSKNANGYPISFRGTAFQCDTGKYGIWADDTLDSAAVGMLSQITHGTGASPGVTGSEMIKVDGQVNIDFSNVRTNGCNLSGVDVTGSSAILRFSGGFMVYNYDMAAADVPAINVAAGNSVKVYGDYIFGSSGGTGGRYSATGNIFIDDWRDWTPAFTSTAGAFGTDPGDTTATGRWKQVGNTVYYQVGLLITDHGTASGLVRFTIPGGTTCLGQWVGNGRENQAGNQLQVWINNNVTEAIISKYDNGSPIADGAQIFCWGQYKIAN